MAQCSYQGSRFFCLFSFANLSMSLGLSFQGHTMAVTAVDIISLHHCIPWQRKGSFFLKSPLSRWKIFPTSLWQTHPQVLLTGIKVYNCGLASKEAEKRYVPFSASLVGLVGDRGETWLLVDNREDLPQGAKTIYTKLETVLVNLSLGRIVWAI